MPDGPGAAALVVDDDDVRMAQVPVRLLGREGDACTTAGDGAGAWLRLAEHPSPSP